jgi:ferredoxin
MCTLGSPDVFVIGDDPEGRAEVAVPVMPEDRLEEMKRAEAGCPEQAIRLDKVTE